MNSNINIVICYLTFMLFSTTVCVDTESVGISLEQEIEQQLLKEHLQYKHQKNIVSDKDIILSLKRKRRYLEFPEGSSFQLVYDLIVGVVDFTNYLILGVTVALAWELPSKPPSEIFEDFTERLRDGTLGTTRNDTLKNIKYVDIHKKTPKLQPMFRPPMHSQYYTHRKSDSFYKYPSNEIPQNLNRYKTLSNYNNNNYFTPNFKYEAKNSMGENKYPWWNLSERVKNSFINRSHIRKFDKNINHLNKNHIKTHTIFSGSGLPEHQIYPVFGKRSTHNKIATFKSNRRFGFTTELLTKIDRIHIEYHRKSRHNLYQRIETYLNGRGSHGHHCVLRALCETGQKSNELKPGSFVGELMRTIFTIPEPFDETSNESYHMNNKEQRYDVAHAEKGECASRYKQCKDSLWSSYFVI